MKLLLDEMRYVEDVGLLHTVIVPGARPYIRRRSFRCPRLAAQTYFEYGDIMALAGYVIHNPIDKPWYYEIHADGGMIESVELLWAKQSWHNEMKLLEHKKK